LPEALIDCYVLAPERSAAVATGFLERFLPQREPRWQPEDVARALGTAPGETEQQVMTRLQDHAGAAYRLYWRNPTGASPYYAIVAFNSDGSLVLGLSLADATEAGVCLVAMEEQVGSEFSYWTREEPPVGSEREFCARARRATDGDGRA